MHTRTPQSNDEPDHPSPYKPQVLYVSFFCPPPLSPPVPLCVPCWDPHQRCLPRAAAWGSNQPQARRAASGHPRETRSKTLPQRWGRGRGTGDARVAQRPARLLLLLLLLLLMHAPDREGRRRKSWRRMKQRCSCLPGIECLLCLFCCCCCCCSFLGTVPLPVLLQQRPPAAVGFQGSLGAPRSPGCCQLGTLLQQRSKA